MLKTPVMFGPGFKRPTKKTLRLERAKKGPKLFTGDEIRKLLDTAGLQLKAMILLACNAGLGNSDLANLPLSSLRWAGDIEERIADSVHRGVKSVSDNRPRR